MGFLDKLLSKGKSSNTPTVPQTVAPTSSASSIVDTPPFQGDYAKTIFLWALNKITTVKNNDEYVRYFLYELGITNPSSYHNQLIAEGYFEMASLSDMLNTLKVAELKQILADVGESATGKKDALIEKVAACISDEKMRQLFPAPHFVLSEKGSAFIAEHNDYVLIHQHKNWGINWKDYDSRKKPGYSFFDIVWGILNERVLTDTHSFGRNTYLCMYQLLKEEGRKANALEMLLQVLHVDCSGSLGMDCYSLYKNNVYSKQELLECFNIAVMIAPGLFKDLGEFADVYDDSVADHVCERRLPIQICSKELFKRIVGSVFDGTYNEADAEALLKKAYCDYITRL